MFEFFERLVDPFPAQKPQRPPSGIYDFCRYYTKGMEPWLLLMAGLTAVTAIAEALLFAILGQVVDWLASSDPATFIEQSAVQLIAMSLFVLLFIPLITAVQSLVMIQGKCLRWAPCQGGRTR